MSIAWISLVALLAAVTLSMFTKVNVGIVSLAFAWIVGVYLGGLPLNTVIGAFPIQLFLTLTGVTLLFGMAHVNGTLERLAARAVEPVLRQRRHHPVDVLSRGAGAFDDRSGQHRDRCPAGTDGHGDRPSRAVCRRS